jgi:predicted DNA-binding transcriptional regulator AlpA
MSRLLTVKQVAEKLGMSPEWVRDHSTRKRPLLPSVKFGPENSKAARRYREEDIERFVAEHLMNKPD